MKQPFRASALIAMACSAATACQDVGSRVSSYPVLVHAYDDGSNPLPGVQIAGLGRELGATEESGDRLMTLQGTEGQRISLSATCPAGYAGPREQPVLLLKRVQSLQAPGIQPIEVSLTCDAKEHISIVAIKTGRAGIPINLRGQAVALTSSSGSAHVMLREPVGTTFQLTLDTSAAEDLRPESPTRMFTIGQRDAFTVWDQPFAQEKKPPPPPVKKKWKRKAPAPPAEPPPPPPPPRHIPERL